MDPRSDPGRRPPLEDPSSGALELVGAVPLRYDHARIYCVAGPAPTSWSPRLVTASRGWAREDLA
ncbi:hypothetical protein [Amycolatopsis sp. EV170708-02-1]|uniref:hypothetical protein n=1 Tax=Amycolatopsis sp. EV170708-02-1 TaxID=2919322 RepID=UPI001F0C0A29|nr:hypothetical protein [Amycolatopsis sp. EV170708-02-1]UMP04811.1 hypothetical protein MJQ72_08220 [Amycolatopsis sp. EV170708-02-1]